MSVTRMILGTYTFEKNPTNLPELNAVKSAAMRKTLGGIAYWSWGTFIKGKEVPLRWSFMPATMYEELTTLNDADAPLLWDLQDGTSRTYTVEIFDLNGDHHQRLGAAAGVVRKNVTLDLIILERLT